MEYLLEKIEYNGQKFKDITDQQQRNEIMDLAIKLNHLEDKIKRSSGAIGWLNGTFYYSFNSVLNQEIRKLTLG